MIFQKSTAVPGYDAADKEPGSAAPGGGAGAGEPGGKAKRGRRGKAKRGRRGNPGSGILPSGAKFMRSTAAASMREERDSAPEGSDERAVWDGCIMRRAGEPVRAIAAKLGMTYPTMRRRLVSMEKNWKERVSYPDSRYVDRGRFYLFTTDEKKLFGRLKEINKGKRGRPFLFCDEFFLMLSVFQLHTRIRYRQAAGMARDEAGGRFRTPSFSTIQKRINRLEITEGDVDGQLWFGKGKARQEVALLVMDGSSLKATSRSEYRQAVYKNCNMSRHKIIVAADRESKKSLYVMTQGPDTGEQSEKIGKVLVGALKNIEENPNMTLAQGAVMAYDGAADSDKTYEIADKAGVGLLVPVRINSSADPVPDGPGEGEDGEAPAAPNSGDPAAAPAAPNSGDPAAAPAAPAAPDPGAPASGRPQPRETGAALRKKAIYKQLGGFDEVTPETEEALRNMSVDEKKANRRKWRTTSGYSDRSLIEGCFSTVKRVFGDEVRSKKPENAEREIRLMFAAYNNMIDQAMVRGQTAVRIRLPSCENACVSKGSNAGIRQPGACSTAASMPAHRTGRGPGASRTSGAHSTAVCTGGGGRMAVAGADRGPAGADRGPAGADRGPAGADRGPAGVRKEIGSRVDSEGDGSLVGAMTEYG